jgi:hypothetical protein
VGGAVSRCRGDMELGEDQTNQDERLGDGASVFMRASSSAGPISMGAWELRRQPQNGGEL